MLLVFAIQFIVQVPVSHIVNSETALMPQTSHVSLAAGLQFHKFHFHDWPQAFRTLPDLQFSSHQIVLHSDGLGCSSQYCCHAACGYTYTTAINTCVYAIHTHLTTQ